MRAAEGLAVQAIGECMVEVARTASGARVTYAGDTYNTAVYLSRVARQLGSPVGVYYLTGIGDDEESARMRADWAANGVTDDSITLRGSQPGLYLVSTDDEGERSFAYWRRDSAAAKVFCGVEWIDRVRGQVIYLSGITLHLLTPHVLDALIERLSHLKAEGARVVFDSNYRATMWPTLDAARRAFDAIVAIADIALVTWADEKELAADANIAACARRLLGLGVAELVIKDGANGAWVCAGGTTQLVATERVNAVDTTAAGDSFNGSYLAARLRGHTPVESARLGNVVAGHVVRHPGAIIDPRLMPVLSTADGDQTFELVTR